MRARPRSQRHKLMQTPWRPHLPYRPARWAPMSPYSTLPELSERVTRSLPAGRQARSWNCCATASAMIERSQINPDNSSWSLSGFSLGLRADVEVQTAGRQAGNIQTERGGRVRRGGVQLRRGPIARGGAVQCSGDGGDKPFRAGSGRWVFSSAPSVRRRLTVRRGRAQDRDHGRIPRRQPLAHQPCHLWRWHAIRSRLQSEPAPNPKSKSYLSRPDLCPSYESALKSAGISSALHEGWLRAFFARARPCAARHRLAPTARLETEPG
jgi:hypothetical protein